MWKREYGPEQSVKTDSFPPQQLATVIDKLTEFGHRFIFQAGKIEGRVKILFSIPETLPKPCEYYASGTLLITKNLIASAMPLRLRYPNSSVIALKQSGVDFGVNQNEIILRSSNITTPLAESELSHAVDNLKTCLSVFPALMYVEIKDESNKEKKWKPILPLSRVSLTTSLISFVGQNKI